MATVNLSAEDFEKMAWDAYLRDSRLQKEAERQNKKYPTPKYITGITRNQLSHYIYNFKEYVYKRLCEKFSRLKNCTPAQLLTHKIEYIETSSSGVNKEPSDKQIVTYAYILLDFNAEVLRYPSLDPSDPDVNNILLLMTKGWDFTGKKRPPFGMWHGEPTVGWSHRNPNDFLETIIEDYNELNLADTKIRAELFPEYKARGSRIDSIDDIIGWMERE